MIKFNVIKKQNHQILVVLNILKRTENHSHSIVAGGFELMS